MNKKKIRKVIYLQSYDNAITWCEDQINDDDDKYIHEDYIKKILKDKIEKKPFCREELYVNKVLRNILRTLTICR